MGVPAPPDPSGPGLPAAASELDVLVREGAGHAAPSVLRCRTVAQEHFQQLTYVRDLLPYTIEQRLGPAGDGTVPTPAEALLAALGSCIAVGVHANAIARAIPIKSLHLDLGGGLRSDRGLGGRQRQSGEDRLQLGHGRRAHRGRRAARRA